jgi:hypothetical protein
VSEIINCAEADWRGRLRTTRTKAHLSVPTPTVTGRQNSLPWASHSPEAAKREPSRTMRYRAAHRSEEPKFLTTPLCYFLGGHGYFWNILVTALSTSCRFFSALLSFKVPLASPRQANCFAFGSYTSTIRVPT